MPGGKPEKYPEIVRQIKETAVHLKLGHGDRLPSERQMAALFCCSHLTVRRALQVLERDNSIYKIAGKGAFYGSRPPELEQSGLVGFVFPDDEIFFYSLFSRLERAFAELNFHAVVHLTRRVPVKEDEILEYFLRQNLSALIAVPNPKCRSIYARLNVPTLFFDLNIPELKIPYVISDGYSGTVAAVKYLISLGHRKIAHIKHLMDNSPSRHQGYLDALAGYGIEPDRRYFKHYEPSRSCGYRAAKELFAQARPPTALLCHNDTVAAGALHYCAESGRKVPRDVSIIGYGDTDISGDLRLTSICQHPDRIASSLLENLRALMSGRSVRNATVIPTGLVVRDSSGPVCSSCR